MAPIRAGCENGPRWGHDLSGSPSSPAVGVTHVLIHFLSTVALISPCKMPGNCHTVIKPQSGWAKSVQLLKML